MADTRPPTLPHTPLNHFLRSAKVRLSEPEGLEDAVYLITPDRPSLDHIVAALAYAYLQTHLEQASKPADRPKRYIPVVHAKRGHTLDRALPELRLALQAALVAPENLTFLDDDDWRTANAYGRNKHAIVVGAAADFATAEALAEWQEVHGMNFVGIIDSQAPAAQLERQLSPRILPPKTEVRGVDPDTSLAALVALHFKAQLAQLQTDTAAATTSSATTAFLPTELADLLLAAVLLESDNLAESKASYLDEGAVGFLEPRSSFQVDLAQQQQQQEDDGEKDGNIPYVPNFPDLDSYYRALKATVLGGSATVAGGLPDEVSPSEVRLPDHFGWNLINGSLLPLVADADAQQPEVPEVARKTIVGEFAGVLTSPAALKLLKPYGIVLGEAAVATQDGGSADGLDFAKVSIDGVVASLLSGDAAAATRGELLCIAVAALHAFVQINWTGPDLPSDLTPYALLRSSASDSFPPRKVEEEEMERDARRIGRIVHRASLDALVFKGEPAYHLCQSPFFLVFAKAVFEALWKRVSIEQEEASAAAVEASDCLETLPWWRLRASTVHSHVLDEAANFGKAIFDPVVRLVERLDRNRRTYDRALAARDASAAAAAAAEEKRRNPWSSLTARLILERGVALQRLGNDREASEKFVEAAKVNGLRYQLGGALGKRTKFQKEEKTQLVLFAKSLVVDGGKDEEEPEPQPDAKDEAGAANSADAAAPEGEKLDDGWQSKVNPEDQVAGMPSTYALNDDLLLEQTQFTSTAAADADADDLLKLDPNSQPSLAVLDQCTLLALCLNIRNTEPTHGLTSNQMSSFITRVIAHPRNWMVHTMSLLLRARLESTRTRTVERSVLQLQALIDQMPTNDSSLQERLKFFHALDLPPKWEMQAELARRYASLGVLRSALEIFERIELWEEVVHCLGLLGRKEEGIEVIRDLLQGNKIEADVDISRRKRLGLVLNDSTAQQVMFGRLDRARESKLWCLLGDLEPTSAERHYTKAWEVSRSSSARAARSMGGVHFAHDNHIEAARWLRLALKINPLYTRSWFVLGCSSMRLERWKDAATCFRRCTALDEEDGESWNNLASCYLRMSEAQDAVDVETGARDASNPTVLDTLYEDENEDEDEWTLSSDGEEMSDRSDSGVELSTDESASEAGTETETETETEGDESDERVAMRSLQSSVGGGGLAQQRRIAATVNNRRRRQQGDQRAVGPSYNLKLLAHRSLERALRFSHDNWRVWYNYMIVSVDVGLLGDATRAMVRCVELRMRSTSLNEADKEKSVDLAVLKRLVDAVTKAPAPHVEASPKPPQPEGGERQAVVRDELLTRAVRALFDETLLTRISSSAVIWREYARLLEWNGEYGKAVQAHLNAYRSGAGNATNEAVTHDAAQFHAACEEVKQTVQQLLRLGPLPANVNRNAQGNEEQQEVEQEVAMKDAKFQARSLVRSFVARTKDEFEDDDEWLELKELVAELR